jgi:hypothetical protein
MPTPVPAGHPEWRSAVTRASGGAREGVAARVRPRDTAPAVSRMCPALRATGRQGHLRLGYRGPRPARSVDIPLPSRGATSAPARCDRQTPGPGRHRRTPRTRVTRAGARATARSAEVMRDTAGAVSRAPMEVGIPMPTRVPAGHPGFDLATPLPRCRACVRRSAPRGDRATCGSGTGAPTGPVGRHPAAESRRDVGTRAMRSSNPGPRQAPPNAPYARHASRCAGHGAERRGHA